MIDQMGRVKLFTLVNVYGQLISDLSGSITQTTTRQEFSVSVEHLVPGFYQLVVSHAGGSEWCKVMVQE
jgi:hypothetical protein